MTWENIVVSSKVVGHISAGIYRGAGGALKELVSNAFDADATRVVITTNWPSFDIITCHDNGVGMTLEKFHKIMSGGIGDSSKRIGETELSDIHKRPLIGRLGIGMLGIAQICHGFKVISHHAGARPSAFEAEVKLADHLREKVEDADPVSEKQIEVGQFNIKEIAYDKTQAGTWIITTDPRAAFVRKFRENSEVPIPSKFDSFLEAIHASRSIAELGDYWRMVWELCVSCPIPYQQEGWFDWDHVKCDVTLKTRLLQMQSTLCNYNFELVVDGLSLRKPNQYPMPQRRSNKSTMNGRLFSIQKDTKVYGRKLKFDGYIYLQDGQAIVPMELRGLLIRIRNVAIGGYDNKFLAYPKIEGPRFSWLSGEVYVEEGLEQALNIDRDSFNEMNSHYVSFQQAIHSLLPTLFSNASTLVRERSQSKISTERSRIEDAVLQFVSEELHSEYKFEQADATAMPLAIHVESASILVNDKSSLWPRSKSKRELAQLIALAYELSMQVPEQERRQHFYTLLTKVLNL